MNSVKRFTLRLPPSLQSVIAKRAEKRMRSINSEIVILLKLGLANETDEPRALMSADRLITQAKGKKRATGNS
jgi:hypothetical protein